MPKKSWYKNSCDTIQHMWGWGVHAFPNGISPNMNVIMRLEFEFASNDVSVQFFSYGNSFNNAYDTNTNN